MKILLQNIFFVSVLLAGSLAHSSQKKENVVVTTGHGEQVQEKSPVVRLRDRETLLSFLYDAGLAPYHENLASAFAGREINLFTVGDELEKRLGKLMKDGGEIKGDLSRKLPFYEYEMVATRASFAAVALVEDGSPAGRFVGRYATKLKEFLDVAHELYRDTEALKEKYLEGGFHSDEH